MIHQIGFIGCGHMAQAIISGMISSRNYQATSIMAFDVIDAQVDKVKKQFNIHKADDIHQVLTSCQIIILAVKPNHTEHVLQEISPLIMSTHIIVSIAAGVSLLSMEHSINKPAKIIRVMPNAPASVLAGMSAMTPNQHVTTDELNEILNIFNSIGLTLVIDEALMHAVTGISGSSPAYVFMFIEALADAGVLEGLPREQAYQLAAQAVMGSAKMVLEKKLHPAILKDMVCSPGGTTIEAVRVLEEKNMRSAVINATLACVEKSKHMN